MLVRIIKKQVGSCQFQGLHVVALLGTLRLQGSLQVLGVQHLLQGIISSEVHLCSRTAIIVRSIVLLVAELLCQALTVPSTVPVHVVSGKNGINAAYPLLV